MKSKKKLAIIVITIGLLLSIVFTYCPRISSKGTYVDTEKGVCVIFENGMKWTFYDVAMGFSIPDDLESGEKVIVRHSFLTIYSIKEIK